MILHEHLGACMFIKFMFLSHVCHSYVAQHMPQLMHSTTPDLSSMMVQLHGCTFLQQRQASDCNNKPTGGELLEAIVTQWSSTRHLCHSAVLHLNKIIEHTDNISGTSPLKVLFFIAAEPPSSSLMPHMPALHITSHPSCLCYCPCNCTCTGTQ